MTNGRRGLIAVAATVCLPLLVAVAAVAGDRWHPTGDMAQAELHVRGFFGHPPLIGAAGRLGTLQAQGSHPGPALWVAMLPGYRLLGQSGWALEAATAMVHAAFVVLVLVFARRRGGTALTVLAALALAVLIRSSGPEAFTEPWNPWLAVLPFFAFLLLVWSVWCDDRAALPWAFGVGTFAVQCHVGYAALVGVLGLGAVLWAIRRQWWVPLAVGAAIAAVMWTPPVIDQVTASGEYPGNLRILYDYFRHPPDPFVGPRAAVKAFAGELNVAGAWVVGRGHQPTDDPNVLGFVAMVAAWASAVALAVRLRLRDALRLHAVLGVCSAVALVSMARVFGDFFDYVIRWMWVLTAVVALATVWTWWLAWRAHPRGRARPHVVGRLAVAALAAVTLVGSVQATGVESSGLRNSRIVAALAPRIADELDRDGTYLVRWDDIVSLGATGVGVLLDLERRGYDVGADRQHRAGVLPSRVLDEADADQVVYVLVGPAATDFRSRPDATLVATVDPRTPEERSRADELIASIDDRLDAAGLDDLTPITRQHLIIAALDPRVPPDVAQDISELIGLGLPAAAFLVPAGGSASGP